LDKGTHFEETELCFDNIFLLLRGFCVKPKGWHLSQNRNFPQKSKFFIKNRNFRQKSKFFIKNRNFCKKSKIFVKNLIFRQKSKIFVKNRNFSQNRKFVTKFNFVSKIEIFLKNRNIPQKPKYYPKVKILVNSQAVFGQIFAPALFFALLVWKKSCDAKMASMTLK